MIKQFKMGFKMLRYAHGIKSCIVWCFITFLMGVLLEIGAVEENVGGNHVAIYLVMMIAIWPLQLLVSLNVPNVVASSPWKKKIQTSVMALISVFTFLISYIVVVSIEGIKYSIGRTRAEDFTSYVIWAACFAMVLMLYMAFSMKYFVVSTIGFIVVMSSTSIIVSLRQYTDLEIFHKTFHPAVTILLGGVLIVVGALLEYGVSLLIYKAPVSKYAQMNSLRKKM